MNVLDSRGRKLVWSYTLLNLYEHICPHQAMRKYVKKDLPFRETVEMKWGTDVHSAFERRLRDKTPLPPNMQQWEGFALPFDGREVLVEEKMGVDAGGNPCDFFADGVWFRGKLDTILVNHTSAALFDWKTGSSRYESPFELELNAVLLKARFPHLKEITGRYVWLKENRLGEAHDLSDTDFTLRVMRDLVGSIEASFASGNWEKRQSGLCSYCDVKDCEHNRKQS